METIQKFIDKVVEGYNSGKLTLEILSNTFSNYMNMFGPEHENSIENLSNAYIMLYQTFINQKLEKLDFKWREYRQTTG